MNAHALRVRIYGLETDAETLKRDPERYARDIAVLVAEIARLRRRLAGLTGADYPVALELSFYEKLVRVIADNRWEATRIESAWLRQHPGGGATRQRAEHSAWAKPLMHTFNQQRRAS